MSFSIKKNSKVSFTTIPSEIPFNNPRWASTGPSNNDISNLSIGPVLINETSTTYNTKNFTNAPNTTLPTNIDVSGSFQTNEYYDLTNFTGNQGQLVSNSDQYLAKLSWNYQGSQYQGYNMFPEDTIYNIAFAQSNSTYKCGAGVVGPNGCIYFAPF